MVWCFECQSEEQSCVCACVCGGLEKWVEMEEGRLLCSQMPGVPALEQVLWEGKGRDEFLRHHRANFSYE